MVVATKNIKILYTSDVHGNGLPIFYGTNEQADLGLAKYATAVKQARKENDQLIVLDNGDLIQGTPLMTHYVKEHQDIKPNPMIGLMNQIGIDAGIIGNHEFNFGKKILNDAIEQANYPLLSANILDEQTTEPYFGRPYVIKHLNDGLKVAIVGVTTHYIPNWESPDHIKGMYFADALITLEKWVKHIHEYEKPDLLIASYHGGFERDIDTGELTEPLTGENQGYQMCEQISGIDVLLTGHQHRQLTGVINDVLVIQPGKNAELYGEIDIELQYHAGAWEVSHKEASLHPLTGVKPDQEAMDYMKELETSTQEWLDQPIGYIDGDMVIHDVFQAKLEKHPFIEFIQKVQMDAAGVDISVASLFNDNSGGFSSVVTMREVVSNYMYPNTFVVLALTGQDIIAAIEKSAEYFMIDSTGEIAVNPVFIAPKPQHYNYDMWEGINYSIHVSKPVGSRVGQVTYHGSPLEKNKTYHVVLNNYRAGGGGNFSMFKNKPIIKEIQIDAVDLILAYFEKHKRVKATATENFKIVI